MAMMATGTGNTYDDDHAVLDDDFLNDGKKISEDIGDQSLSSLHRH